MSDALGSVRWLSVAAAFVPYFINGDLWFTVFFAKPYFRSLGKDNVPQEKPAPIFIIGPAVCSLVITITSAILMRALHVDAYGAALQFGALVGGGYLVANTVNIATNPNIPRPLLYGAISGAFHVTGILIVSTILVAMR